MTISEELSKLFNNTKKYLEDRYELAKLNVIEKLVVFLSLLFTSLVMFSLVLVILFFLSLSLAIYISYATKNSYLGFLAVAGIYIIIGFVLYIFRERIFTQPILKRLINVFYAPIKSKKEE